MPTILLDPAHQAVAESPLAALKQQDIAPAQQALIDAQHVDHIAPPETGEHAGTADAQAGAAESPQDFAEKLEPDGIILWFGIRACTGGWVEGPGRSEGRDHKRSLILYFRSTWRSLTAHMTLVPQLLLGASVVK